MRKLVEKSQDIDAYLSQFPKDQSKVAKELRVLIKKVVPKATEHISYRMPTFKFGGKILIYFAINKAHIGIYPYPSAIKEFKKETEGRYKTSTGTIQFPFDKPLPKTLITKIVKYRLKEVTQRIKK